MSDVTSSPQAVIDAYTKGTATRDVALLKLIFDENAVMTGYLGPDLLNGSVEPFYGALEANNVGADYTSDVTNLTVTDKIALATTEEKNLLGLNFTNHFHMVQRDDGTWRITSKLFRHA